MESNRSGGTTPAAATLAALLRYAHALGCAPLDAQLLLARAIGQPRSFLYAAADSSCAAPARAQFLAWIRRRADGEPLAYITGEREFWSHTLRVTPDVLVPRPETEMLVEHALALCTTHAAGVLDLGTGSGAVALALASERPHWQLIATDASAAALAVATANAHALQLGNCAFLLGNWYAPLSGHAFNLIVSNPPYIAPDDPALLDPGLRHEPQQALVSPPDGLAALRDIVAGAQAHLVAGGALALEHGSTQGHAVAKMLVQAGFDHVRCHADLAGHPRITAARKPE